MKLDKSQRQTVDNDNTYVSKYAKIVSILQDIYLDWEHNYVHRI